MKQWLLVKPQNGHILAGLLSNQQPFEAKHNCTHQSFTLPHQKVMLWVQVKAETCKIQCTVPLHLNKFHHIHENEQQPTNPHVYTNIQQLWKKKKNPILVILNHEIFFKTHLRRFERQLLWLTVETIKQNMKSSWILHNII